MLLRVRVTSFLCGFAVAGAAAMAALRNDVLRSAELVSGEARRSRAELEGRVSRLEVLLGVKGGEAAPGPAKHEEPSAPSAEAIGLARRVLADAAAADAEAAAAAAAPAS
jgi:hypothetical protein